MVLFWISVTPMMRRLASCVLFIVIYRHRSGSVVSAEIVNLPIFWVIWKVVNYTQKISTR